MFEYGRFYDLSGGSGKGLLVKSKIEMYMFLFFIDTEF